jgi:hypothetical protein
MDDRIQRIMRTEGSHINEAGSWPVNYTRCRVLHISISLKGMGAAGLDFETWDSTNLAVPLMTFHQCSVPHPFAFFLAKGWESKPLTPRAFTDN